MKHNNDQSINQLFFKLPELSPRNKKKMMDDKTRARLGMMIRFIQNI